MPNGSIKQYSPLGFWHAMEILAVVFLCMLPVSALRLIECGELDLMQPQG